MLSGDGKRLPGWAHSDRAHRDPSTIRTLPLILRKPTRLPIDLTLTSTLPRSQSVLATMPAESQTILHDGLIDALMPELARVAGSK
jgi:hypothetical protein